MTARHLQRAQLALEQIGEDEALTGDLTDHAAQALVLWIEAQIVALDVLDDARFDQAVMRVRRAARQAARQAAMDEVRVVEYARAALLKEI